MTQFEDDEQHTTMKHLLELPLHDHRFKVGKSLQAITVMSSPPSNSTLNLTQTVKDAFEQTIQADRQLISAVQICKA